MEANPFLKLISKMEIEEGLNYFKEDAIEISLCIREQQALSTTYYCSINPFFLHARSPFLISELEKCDSQLLCLSKSKWSNVEKTRFVNVMKFFISSQSAFTCNDITSLAWTLELSMILKIDDLVSICSQRLGELGSNTSLPASLKDLQVHFQGSLQGGKILRNDIISPQLHKPPQGLESQSPITSPSALEENDMNSDEVGRAAKRSRSNMDAKTPTNNDIPGSAVTSKMTGINGSTARSKIGVVIPNLVTPTVFAMRKSTSTQSDPKMPSQRPSPVQEIRRQSTDHNNLDSDRGNTSALRGEKNIRQRPVPSFDQSPSNRANSSNEKYNKRSNSEEERWPTPQPRLRQETQPFATPRHTSPSSVPRHQETTTSYNAPRLVKQEPGAHGSGLKSDTVSYVSSPKTPTAACRPPAASNPATVDLTFDSDEELDNAEATASAESPVHDDQTTDEEIDLHITQPKSGQPWELVVPANYEKFTMVTINLEPQFEQNYRPDSLPNQKTAHTVYDISNQAVEALCNKLNSVGQAFTICPKGGLPIVWVKFQIERFTNRKDAGKRYIIKTSYSLTQHDQCHNLLKIVKFINQHQLSFKPLTEKNATTNFYFKAPDGRLVPFKRYVPACYRLPSCPVSPGRPTLLKC